MTARHFWIGLAAIVIAVLAHAALPRYEWRESKQYTDVLIRIDRWTGVAEMGAMRADWGRWVSAREMRRDSDAKVTRAAIQAERRQLDKEINDFITQATAASASKSAKDVNLPYEVRRPADCSAKAQATNVDVAIECTLADYVESSKPAQMSR